MTQALQPIPMLLWCPFCKERHIDEGEFATKVHHTHACQSCGAVWRLAIEPTVGVRFLPGFKNEEPQTQQQEIPVTESTTQAPAQPAPILTPEEERHRRNQEQQVRMRSVSGNVTSTEPIIAFLYVLLRDHLLPGTIEDIMINHVPQPGETTAYSNGWLAHYAADIGRRLLAPAPAPAPVEVPAAPPAATPPPATAPAEAPAAVAAPAPVAPAAVESSSGPGNA